jgi:DNA polymerase V
MLSRKPDSRFGLIDCDNFYVSCERVFQPWLKGRPVVVLSNNDGCIVARSKEAKAFNIGMGIPYYKVKDLITKNNVKVFSSNYTLYADMSYRVMEVLREYLPKVDIYSIDEAFVEFNAYDDTQAGRLIRKEVAQRTGIPITVGIGSTKTLAKIATEYAKAHEECGHVFDLTYSADPASILKATLAQDVWGIGTKIARWLYERNITTAFDLQHISDAVIRKRAGITGLRTVFELRGISCIELRSVFAPRKNVISSRSFGRYVTDISDIKESVAMHATIAAAKLRQDKSVAGQLSAYVTTNVYAQNPQYAATVSVSVHPSTNATCELVKLAMIAVEKAYKPGFRYIKAGVELGNITPARERQIDLFARRDMDKEERLYRAVDAVNGKYGSDTIRPSASGIERNWRMKQDHNSNRYTTEWNDLIVTIPE